MRKLITGIFFLLLAACKGNAPLPEGTVSNQQVVDFGLNPCHRIVIEQGKIYYNGQRLRLNTPVQQWIDVLGPYSRKVKQKGYTYFWDKIGFVVDTDVDVIFIYDTIVKAFALDFNLYMDEDLDENYDKVTLDIRKGMLRNNCKYFFRGNILVDGAPLGRGTNIKDFLKQTRVNYKSFFLSRFYDYEYRDAVNIPRTQASIYISHDYLDIEQFNIYIKDWD